MRPGLPSRGGVTAAAALVVAALGTIAPAPATATVRMVARPVFTPLSSLDAAACVVDVENDEQERRVTLRGRRGALSQGPVPAAEADMRLDLEPGARKRVLLVLPPNEHPRGVIELLERDESIAVTAVDFSWADYHHDAVVVIGDAPRSLILRARQDLEVAVQLALPADLPPTESAWPTLPHAIVWPEPRSSELTSDQARTLARLVASGRRLVVGVSAEEPEALEAAGLGDLLPARASRGDGLEVLLGGMRAGSSTLAAEGAVARAYGFGMVVLVPRSLDDVAPESWPEIAAVSAPDLGRGESLRARPWRVGSPFLAESTVSTLSPEPPLAKAAALLGLFFLAAVPLDAWLTRRSLKRGHRSRFGALRYPALVLLFTAAGFVVAQTASGGGQRMVRFDFVEVAEDGAALGRTFLYVSRGRNGPAEVRAHGAAVVGVHVIHDYGAAGYTVRHALHESPEPSDPPSHLTMQVGSWQPVAVTAAWTPAAIPRVEAPASACDPPVVPACDGAWYALRWPEPACPETRNVAWAGTIAAGPLAPGTAPDARLHALLPAAAEAGSQPSDLVLAFARSLGPRIDVDGAAADETWTFVRYRFSPPAAPSETTP